MEPTAGLAFVFGLTGSLAVELILIYKAIGPKGGLPGKYKTRLFWFVRLALALASGIIAVAYFSPQIPLFLYVHIGAATPTIIARVSQVADSDDESVAG